MSKDWKVTPLMCKIKLFDDNAEEYEVDRTNWYRGTFDSITMTRYYLEDKIKWREYIYNNIWYFFERTRFLNFEADDRDELKQEFMLFIDRKINEQIDSWRVKDYSSKTANTLVRYIIICMKWILVNMSKKKWDLYIDDIELDSKPNNDMLMDIDYEYEWLLSEFIYNNGLSKRDQSIALLYTWWHNITEISKWLWIDRHIVDESIKKLRKKLVKYLWFNEKDIWI